MKIGGVQKKRVNRGEQEKKWINWKESDGVDWLVCLVFFCFSKKEIRGHLTEDHMQPQRNQEEP